MKEEFNIRLRILKLYKSLLNQKLDADEIADIYREYLRLKVRLGTNSPLFKEDLKKYRHVNCYGYALGLDLPGYFYNRYNDIEIEGIRYNLGFISKGEYPYNDDIRLGNLYKDLETLGVKYFETDSSSQNMYGGYKIAIYSSLSDFHLVRQNADKSWSDKLGYSFEFRQEEKLNPPENKYKLLKVLEIVKPVIK